MASPSSRPLVDRLIPGGLKAYLATARSNGESYQTIAIRLAVEHDIRTTAQTVSAWCRELDVAA